MSLVGSLEDLGLGDILQIICLSGKSGVLHLRADSGEGRILFDQGRIRISHLGPHPPTLESLGGDADPEQLEERLRQEIEESVLCMFSWASGEFSFEVGDVAEHAGDTPCLDPGLNPQFLALEGTRLADERAAGRGGDAVEDKTSPPVSSPEWGPDPEGGEESRPSAAPQEAWLAASAPSADFSDLAMDDGTLEHHPKPLDEGPVPGAELLESVAVAHAGAAEDSELLEAEPWLEAVPEHDEVPLFLGEDESPPALLGEAGDAPPALLGEAESSPQALLGETDGSPPVHPGAPGDGSPALLREDQEVVPKLVGESEDRTATDLGENEVTSLPPLVLIDPDRPVVEWARGALPDGLAAAHLFQTTDQGVQRIRQYLRRAQPPLVVLSASLPNDALSGARSLAELLERLQRQAPQMRILLLEETGRALPPPLERLGVHRARVSKPTATQLADSRLSEGCERLAREFRAGLLAACGVATPTADGAEIGELREISIRLRDSASGGEVLPQVLDFATRSFSRVALFMIREGEAQGIAHVGLPLAGGPDDAGFRQLGFDVSGSSWLRKLVETRAPLRVSPAGGAAEDGDAALVDSLGALRPGQAWLGPIVSANQVVAFLYADRLPADEAIGDTAGLEVVLHHAGLALDRAALERALEEPGP